MRGMVSATPSTHNTCQAPIVSPSEVFRCRLRVLYAAVNQPPSFWRTALTCQTVSFGIVIFDGEGIAQAVRVESSRHERRQPLPAGSTDSVCSAGRVKRIKTTAYRAASATTGYRATLSSFVLDGMVEAQRRPCFSLICSVSMRTSLKTGTS